MIFLRAFNIILLHPRYTRIKTISIIIININNNDNNIIIIIIIIIIITAGWAAQPVPALELAGAPAW